MLWSAETFAKRSLEIVFCTSSLSMVTVHACMLSLGKGPTVRSINLLNLPKACQLALEMLVAVSDVQLTKTPSCGVITGFSRTSRLK